VARPGQRFALKPVFTDCTSTIFHEAANAIGNGYELLAGNNMEGSGVHFDTGKNNEKEKAGNFFTGHVVSNINMIAIELV
jgi:hypothetical protein